MIETSNLSVGYGKNIIISGIDVKVQKGTIVTVIGPNGSGKSTILKTITKQLEKLGGTICVCGKDLAEMKENEAAAKISMVMTERIHPENMTCRDVIATGRYPYTGRLGILSEDDWKFVEEAVQMVHCEDVLDSDFNKISDGQRQRVMLARAICQDTDVIILDEPTSFLDLFYKLDLMKIIRRLADEKHKAVFMSLHELELVKAVSDKVICVDGKKVVKYGDVEDIFCGDFISELYGIQKEEFNSETATLNLDIKKCTRDCKGGSAVTERSDVMKANAGTLKSPTLTEGKGCARKNHAKVIMVQGTMSNAGKSLVVAGLCRIFRQDGYRVAPFKSQNMALNSFITKEGLEMGRAQVMQAEAAGIEPEVCMNPILLKPTNNIGSQVIVNGEVLGNMPAREYFEYKTKLIPEIIKAFRKLESYADIIVIEGAGSPAEINLRKNDIVNMGLAEMLNAPVLLVGDIDRGGVFAQLLGTMELLEPDEKKRVKGLIVNKFRGDKTILDPGIEMLEKKTGIPVTGVLPYLNISLDDEDSLSSRFEKHGDGIVNIGIIKLPRISNFTDFSVFEQIEGVALHYIEQIDDVEKMDMIVLPGSKNTIGDLRWLRESGLEAAVKKFAAEKPVFGICGGYQMLGEIISDPDFVEEGGEICGMELLPVETVLRKEKTRTQVSGKFGNVKGVFDFLSDMDFSGYEIHMGESICKNKNADNSGKLVFLNNVYGTYVHGIFDESELAFKIVSRLAELKGVELKKNLNESFKEFKESQYNLLAESMRQNMDMEAVYGMLREAELPADLQTDL